MTQVQVTPQQQMALAFRGFPLPELKPMPTTMPSGKVVDQYLAFTIREDGQWVEAIGFDQERAIANLVREVSRP